MRDRRADGRISPQRTQRSQRSNCLVLCDPWMTMNPQSLSMPPRLNRLSELAKDLWWTWNPAAREVFRRLDYTLWRQTAHNPVLMLRNVSSDLLALAANDPDFLRAYDAALDALDRARTAR